ncbi:MAG: hypothetical protein H7210_01265 [Pyrinomonadaceae bacterium]|nr:hypothetical protein [Phycisphaerales bacterium]
MLLVLLSIHAVNVTLQVVRGIWFFGAIPTAASVPSGPAWMAPPHVTPGIADVVLYVLYAAFQPIAIIDNTFDNSGPTLILTSPTRWEVQSLVAERWFRDGVWATLWAPMTAVSLAFPLMLLALPGTRRLAKVRSVHVARAFIYSLSWIPALALFRTLRLAVELFDDPYKYLFTSARRSWLWDWLPGESSLHHWRYHVVALLFLWLSGWWLSCIWKGLRLPRPLLTWGVVLIAVTLVGLLAWIYV